LGYIESRREILASEGFDVDALVGGVIDAELARRTLQNFIRHAVLRRATDAPVSQRALVD
ncbi:MAG TPA: hypothetical protein VLS89_17250, partial [Candidatus Nanopelagicales bacterium]|nr:hypothetical protein [Candidatus Nanopelagicales bacterium]